MHAHPSYRSFAAGLRSTGLVLLSLSIAACSNSNGGDDQPRQILVFGAEANRLHAYEPYDGDIHQVVIPSQRDQPDSGRDINAQICFDPDGSHRFIAGEDTNQPNPLQGWGFFQLNGDAVGNLSAAQIGKLTPTYQGSVDNAENYGCGFLADGRLVTSDVGDEATGPANGQLILWFPPFDSREVRYCKLDVSIGTAGGIWVDAQDRVYVTSARGEPGVYRYDPPFPTSNDASGGCGKVDVTGAPLADSVRKTRVIPTDANILTPNAVAPAPDGGFYVSSVINGVIAQYDSNYAFVRRVLEPPAGETLGPVPFSTGTPLGIGVDSRGTLYYADIGVVVDSSGIGPGRKTGTMRKIAFVKGEPQPPVTMQSGLDFPDGIGILEE
ncbi:MAG: SMP-30/Gluconolactonase/LRE-like region [Pseudomonadota bacterium]|jgi:hypothetical protein